MTDKDSFNMTQRELLIRIDERLKNVERQIDCMQRDAVPTNEHAQLMATIGEHEVRLDDLDGFKLKMGIWMTIAGAAGGVVVSIMSGLFNDLIKSI